MVKFAIILCQGTIEKIPWKKNEKQSFYTIATAIKGTGMHLRNISLGLALTTRFITRSSSNECDIRRILQISDFKMLDF